MNKRTMKPLDKHSHFGNGSYKSVNISFARRPIIEEGDEIIILKKKKKDDDNALLGCLFIIVLIIIGIFQYPYYKSKTDSSSKEKKTQRSESSYDSASDIAQPAKIEPEDRTWTNRKDGRTITGKYLEYKDGKASVLRDNGKTVTIPLELLSDEDREYIKSIRKQNEGR